jgi:hypothetical protein
MTHREAFVTSLISSADSSMAVVDNSASTSAILALFATLALADNSSSIAYTSVKIDADEMSEVTKA